MLLIWQRGELKVGHHRRERISAKKLNDTSHLKKHSHDRHIGQILVRVMNREEDMAYLEAILAESRHLEVRKAAKAQLELVRQGRSDK